MRNWHVAKEATCAWNQSGFRVEQLQGHINYDKLTLIFNGFYLINRYIINRKRNNKQARQGYYVIRTWFPTAWKDARAVGRVDRGAYPATLDHIRTSTWPYSHRYVPSTRILWVTILLQKWTKGGLAGQEILRGCIIGMHWTESIQPLKCADMLRSYREQLGLCWFTYFIHGSHHPPPEFVRASWPFPQTSERLILSLGIELFEWVTDSLSLQVQVLRTFAVWLGASTWLGGTTVWGMNSVRLF